ncbi:MAG: potassium/proton antiporter [Clostridia bacterium]|nr:potassium/proton antiporter [Clostridia bacterium]
MAVFLLVTAVVIIACVLLNKLSSKLGIPMLLAFIVLGMVFGGDGLFGIEFEDYTFAEQICSTALIFIMFYGGFGTKWSEAKPIAVKATLLSTVGVVLTAGITGLFCHFVLNFTLLEGLLVGAVVSSTDAASVFSILRSNRLNLKHRTASLLEVESGSNDPCAYMLTAIVLSFINGTADGGRIAYEIFAQIVYGAAFGVLIAFLAGLVLKRHRFSTSGFDTAFVLAVAILAYAAPAALGGNGYLSAYIVGIYLGNTDIKNKKALVNFFDGLTGLMQMLLFFLLGLLATPSRMPPVILPALLLFLFITLIARPAAVFAILAPFKCNWRQSLLVSWAGLRGAASIVFAVIATVGLASGAHDIFHTVFLIVLFSIPVQGSLIPFFAKKLDMIDDTEDVMKTFSDYSDEVPIQYIQFTIPTGHAWNNMRVGEIHLPPDTILVIVKRKGKSLIPHGKTVIHEGDTMVLSAKAPGEIEGMQLSEKYLAKGDPLIGHKLSELPKREGRLIVMIQRDSKIIIPKGDTVLKAGDMLVINRVD